MSSTNPHRNRGNNGCWDNCRPSRRGFLKKQSIYSGLRGLVVDTPDGLGTIRGDSNRLGGSRKFIIQLMDGRIRRYSMSEINDLTGVFRKMERRAWDERWELRKRRCY